MFFLVFFRKILFFFLDLVFLKMAKMQNAFFFFFERSNGKGLVSTTTCRPVITHSSKNEEHC